METRTQTPTLWQMILLVLSVYVLGALFAQTFWTLSPEVVRLPGEHLSAIEARLDRAAGPPGNA